MPWEPMSRAEAEAVMAEHYPLTGLTSVKRAAERLEAQLVLEDRTTEYIYERLTDFLGHRPDEPPATPP
jgi:hypothetical protein